MGKNKLRQFAELDTFHNVFQKDGSLKGKWSTEFFKNDHPIVLELACGKGEYTVNLSKKFPEKNFIGIDLKGNRLWTGAKMAIEEQINNVAFLRIQIEHLQSYFEHNEVDEIWITFPDPQPQVSREKKRLTSMRFLEVYRPILKENAIIHLKTDNDQLYEYTLEVIADNKLDLLANTNDVYNSALLDDVLQIKTYYERKYLSQGKNINYVRFRL
ncbi:tRNA (guanosine(46)-N7)-methyltransferase TrmB [Solitalea canadensis]|uniref:tRNA (guanine-N(7)-)-methyltransferase n=1 Tax=Solitalea canadensis (strain ATCC 29591 / DSM 3403 / JCM 21819 / LMG 8368 / NBRC 15130 / NCIMB 12057 / USAM 9D) TaxID=929556 RepID=H8KL71_SOLCM|nr:tRNA (guanosine(46)-N7)-methyltransferase TrmB [Solitalea canadensis]AFD09154.1 tRNA (guanine-N(7)-)-methyltransferase [Solitalea canadensis DSM 3403]